jgi:hypothetical protein
MATDGEQYTPLRVMRKSIAAEDYNRIRLGLLRERLPWEIRLERFRCLVCVLDEGQWLCLDECNNGLPVLAWRNFSARRSASLDAPVECDLYLYHIQAGLLMGNVLEALAQAVDRHRRARDAHGAPVSAIRRPDDQDEVPQ